MRKNIDSNYNGGKLKSKELIRVGIRAEPPPVGFEQFKVDNRVYLFCTKKVLSRTGEYFPCDFAIRKDRLLADRTNIQHKCKCVQLENFTLTTKVREPTPLAAIYDELARFVGTTGVSLRIAKSNSMRRLIGTCIDYGKSVIETPTQNPFKPLPESHLRERLVKIAKQDYDTILAEYKKFAFNCLAIDAGVLNSISLLICIIVNPLEKQPPLCVLIEPHFRGKTVDYNATLLLLINDLLNEGIGIGSIISDSLRAQLNSVSHLSTKNFFHNHSNSMIRGILWLPCSCHLLNLCINDVAKEVPEINKFIASINEARNFFRRKPIACQLERAFPSYSKTRWTGLTDVSTFILNNAEHLSELIASNIEHHEIPEIVIECITSAAAIFPIFICFSIAIKKLERNDAVACDIYPTIHSMLVGLAEVSSRFDYLKKYIDVAVSKVHTRFFQSQYSSLMTLAYFITPSGRDYYRRLEGVEYVPDSYSIGDFNEPKCEFDPKTIQIFAQINEKLSQWILRQQKLIKHVCAGVVDDREMEVQQHMGPPIAPHDFHHKGDLSAMEMIRQRRALSMRLNTHVHYADDDTMESDDDSIGDTESDSDENHIADKRTNEEEDECAPIEMGPPMTDGLLVVLQDLLMSICQRKGLPRDETNSCVAAFTVWLTDDIIRVPGRAVLQNRTLFIRTMKSAPKWREFTNIIMQLTSMAASEAVVERGLSMLRYLNDPRKSRSKNDLILARFRLASFAAYTADSSEQMKHHPDEEL